MHLSRTLVACGLALLLPLPLHRVGASPSLMGNMRVERVTVSEVIPAQTGLTYRINNTLGAGQIKTGGTGQDGHIDRVLSRVYLEDKLAIEKVISESVVPAQTKTIEIGAAGFATGLSSFTLNKVVTMEATAYTPDAGLGSRATFRTRTGRRAEYGVVAVDPRVVPLNTLVFVEGYGLALACDTGGAIKGNRIDVCVTTNRTAVIWGRKKVKVHVFKQTIGQPLHR